MLISSIINISAIQALTNPAHSQPDLLPQCSVGRDWEVAHREGLAQVVVMSLLLWAHCRTRQMGVLRLPCASTQALRGTMAQHSCCEQRLPTMQDNQIGCRERAGIQECNYPGVPQLCFSEFFSLFFSLLKTLFFRVFLKNATFDLFCTFLWGTLIFFVVLSARMIVFPVWPPSAPML